MKKMIFFIAAFFLCFTVNVYADYTVEVDGEAENSQTEETVYEIEMEAADDENEEQEAEYAIEQPAEETVYAVDTETDESVEQQDTTAAETVVAEPTVPPAKKVIYAVESELACINGETVNTWARPFVYDDVTFVPLRYTVESLGGEVVYDGPGEMLGAFNGENHYSIWMKDSNVRIYDGVSFVPVRSLCETLGFKVDWYSGIIAVSKNGTALSEEEVSNYKSTLQYTGYTDAFLTPRKVVNPYTTYTYEQMNSDLALLQRMYPDLFWVYSIGKTTEGRDLTAFTFGRGEKNIILCASMHAREYIATNFIMDMVDNYALGYTNNETRDGYSFREALDSVKFIIVPMVNPDGINIVQNGFDSAQNAEYLKSLPVNSYGSRGWKTTSTGTDLNNNFDLLWYSHGSPSYAGYSGASAASEPETRAMQSLIDNTNFSIFASFHTQGQVLYWMDPNCNQDLIPKFEPYIDRICWEIGFEKMPSDGTYGYSGYMTDYVRYFRQAMAMTLELCPYIGDYPYPESDFDTIAYPVRNIGLILADIAKYL